MTTHDDFAVPIDDLQPRSYERLPNGKYTGEVTISSTTNNKGWEAIEVTVANLATADGKDEVQRRDGEAIRLAGQTRRTRITTVSENAQASEIGKRQLTALAYALGLAEIIEGDDGRQAARFAFESTEDALEQLSSGQGLRVGFGIKNRERKRKNEAGAKVVQKDDSGNPIMDDEITQFYPAALVAKEG
jgi:hypothetical protein